MINPPPEQEAQWEREKRAGLVQAFQADPQLANNFIARHAPVPDLIDALAAWCVEHPDAGRAYLDRWDKITPKVRRGLPDPNYAPVVRARARALWAQNGQQRKTACPETDASR